MKTELRRVEILQGSSSGYWKRGQYGYVITVNTKGGMHFVNTSRQSAPGEPAFLVSKAKHGRGGALWFSAAGIRFTGKGVNGTSDRRSHSTMQDQLHVGQRFDHFGHTYEILKIGRDKDRTVQIARPHMDRFGKIGFIDRRSFPARDFDRQHLRPLH